MDYSHLPIEMRLLILSQLSSSDLLHFFDLFQLDWPFWKKLASDLLSIPSWYFDLTFDRKISGAYRYLELLSKFEVIEESLATIDQGIVSGIYTPEKLFYLAVRQNNTELMKKLLPLINPKLIKKIEIDHSFILMNSETRQLGEMVNLFSESTEYSRYYYIKTENSSTKRQQDFIDILADENWNKIIDYLPTEYPNILRFRLICLIYSKKPEAMVIVKSYFQKLPKEDQPDLLRAVIQTGREEETDWMSQFLSEYLGEFNQKFQSSTISGCYYYPIRTDKPYRNYNLLKDAYLGGNINLINRFEKLGYSINRNDALNLIIKGYKSGLSNLVSVYSLLKEKGLESYSFYKIGDIEILSLADTRDCSFIEACLNMYKSRSWDNLNFLNRIIGHRDGMHRKVEKMYSALDDLGRLNPLVDQIFKSY